MKNLFLSVSLFAAMTGYSQPVLTGFRLVKGETYYHNSSTKSKIKQLIQGMDVDIDMEIKSGTQLTVTDVADSLFLLNVRYNKMSISMKLPTGELVMSSDGDTTQIVNRLFKQLSSASFPIKMSRSGRILEVGQLDEIVDRMLNAAGVPEAQLPTLRKTVQGSFGEASFKGSFETLTNIYSNKPVKLHDHWHIATHLASGMDAVVELNYEWKENTPVYNLIEGTGTILSEPDGPFRLSGDGFFAKYNIAGKVTASVKTDPKTGWPIDGTIRQNFSGITEIKPGAESAESMKLSMSAQNETKYSSEAPAMKNP